ncbi:unnamed protein product [Merluccius merluccius]
MGMTDWVAVVKQEILNIPLTTLVIVIQVTMMTTILKVTPLHATLAPPRVEVGWEAPHCERHPWPQLCILIHRVKASITISNNSHTCPCPLCWMTQRTM